MGDKFVLGKDSAAEIVPSLQHKGDFLQIKLLFLVKGQAMSFCNLLVTVGDTCVRARSKSSRIFEASF